MPERFTHLITWGATYSPLGRSSLQVVPLPGRVRWMGCGPGSTIVINDGGEVLFSSAASGGRFVAVDDLRGLKVIQAAHCGPYLVALTADGSVYAVDGKATRLPINGGCGLAAGALFAVVWCEDGKVYTMGDNSRGQLGRGEGEEAKSQGFELLPATVKVTRKVLKASCGGSHCVCLCSDGSVIGWGSNRNGEVIFGGQDVVPQPTEVDTGGVSVVDVCCGDGSTIIVDVQGRGYVSGRNPAEGNKGGSRMAPLPFPRILSIAAAGGWRNAHVIAWTEEGLLGVGSNSRGQVTGMPTEADVEHPVQVPLPAMDVPLMKVQVAAGWLHSAALVVTDGRPADGHGPRPNLGEFGFAGSDVLHNLCSYLDKPGLLSLMQTSSRFYNLASDDRHWAKYVPPTRRPDSGNYYRLLVDTGRLKKGARDVGEDGDGVVESLLVRLFPSRATQLRFMILGLDAAGKTTILYYLKIGETITTIPTVGFNVESVQVGCNLVTIWDVGGPDRLRALWRHYYRDTNGIIFVVDSTDRDRAQEAIDELHRQLTSEDLLGVPVLIFANKQDRPGAMSQDEVIDRLDLYSLAHRLWHVQPSCALNGDGLREGLAWLTRAAKVSKKK